MKSWQEWRIETIVDRLLQGGPVCRHAADYILGHDVRIGFARQSTGGRWTLGGDIELNPEYCSPATDPEGAQLLGLVVHEAAHLEQGAALALSVAGEVLGWKAEYAARSELRAPLTNPHWRTIVRILDPPSDHDLRLARAEMLKVAGRRYLIWLLPLRPNFWTRWVERFQPLSARRKHRA